MITCKYCGESVESISAEPDERGNYDPHYTGECMADMDVCMGCLFRADQCQCGRFSDDKL